MLLLLALEPCNERLDLRDLRFELPDAAVAFALYFAVQGGEYATTDLFELRASVAREEAEVSRVLAGIPDPIGTFYRYGLANSILRRKLDLPMETNGKEIAS